MDLDEKLGIGKRIISLRIIRPYDERIEKEFRELKDKLRKEEKQNPKTRKLRKSKIKNFFAEKKKEFPDLITIGEFSKGLDFACFFSRSVYNLAMSDLFSKLLKGEKTYPYGSVDKALELAKLTLLKYRKAEMTEVPSDFKIGISKKISSNFRGKELLSGKVSLPETTTGFLPFYLSQGGKQEAKSLISFQPITTTSGSEQPDDYVLELKAPILRNNIIEFSKIKLLCATNKRARNFKRNRDDATNKLIMDVINNRREKEIKAFLLTKGFGEEKIEQLSRKYNGIAAYELLQKPVKFTLKSEPFVSITVNNLPERATNRMHDIVAGIDFCYSKDKILCISILNLSRFKSDRKKINEWIIGETSILDQDYKLRSVYNDFYNERRTWQKRLARKIETNDMSQRFVLRFNNRRNYLIKQVARRLADAIKKNGVSKIFVENLDSLSQRGDWFTVNKIRTFPRKELFERLKQNLSSSKITVEEVLPKYTSQCCSLCGKRNEKFDFTFRSKNSFPIFECADTSCDFSKNKSDYFKHLRDADLNAARNIALVGTKLLKV